MTDKMCTMYYRDRAEGESWEKVYRRLYNVMVLSRLTYYDDSIWRKCDNHSRRDERSRFWYSLGLFFSVLSVSTLVSTVGVLPLLF